MKDIATQVLQLYYTKMREPQFEELLLADHPLLWEKWCCFITLYLNGEVRGSAGNIKEIHPSLAQEVYTNTIQALTWDKRFAPLTLEESQKLKVRCDRIVERKIISEAEMKLLDPSKSWVIVIKRDYEKLAVILPNISPKLIVGQDFIPVLTKKLKEKTFQEKDYIIYHIVTQVESNY